MDVNSFTNSFNEEHLLAEVSDDFCRFDFTETISVALVKQQPDDVLFICYTHFIPSSAIAGDDIW